MRFFVTMLLLSTMFTSHAQQVLWNQSAHNFTTDKLSVGISTATGKRLNVQHDAFDYTASFVNTAGFGIVIKSPNDPLHILSDVTNTSMFVVSGSGSVGLGTAYPASRFHIESGGFRHGGTGEINVDAPGIIGGRFRILDNGYIGVGRPDPEARFHINEGGFRHGSAGEINIDAPDVIGGRLKILNNGNVGIGTTTPDQKLTVDGTVRCEEVKVELIAGSGPDYVFEPSYHLTPLDEVASYIREHKHLPEVPSAKKMEEEGLNLKEMNLPLLKKVEELTLHLIEQSKELEEQKSKNSSLEERVLILENLKQK